MTEDARVSPMLVPRFVTRFSCLKGECPDTCCFGWDVAVSDEKISSYQRGAEGSGNALRIRIAAEGQRAAENGGRICAQNSGLPCGLLSSDRQCLLWQEYGEEGLPKTCHDYPRVSHRFGDRLEQALSLSCPAAASSAMSEEDAFAFEVAEVPMPADSVSGIDRVGAFDQGSMDEARMLAIQILGVEALDNAECWVALGILCEQIEVCAPKVGADESLLCALREIVEFVESGEVRAVAGKVAADAVSTGGVFALLIGDVVSQARSERQRAVMHAAMNGLGWAANTPIDCATIGRHYAGILGGMDANSRQALDRYLRRFLLNEIFRTAFPWGHQSRSMQHLRGLVALYGSLRLLLVGAIGDAKGALDEQAMIATVQVFSRLATHTPLFFSRAEQLIIGSGGSRLANLLQLIR